MKNKEFDCVEMKHRAAEKISNKLQRYSRRKRLSYWNKRYENMKVRIGKKINVDDSHADPHALLLINRSGNRTRRQRLPLAQSDCISQLDDCEKLGNDSVLHVATGDASLVIIQAATGNDCGTLFAGAVSSFYQHDETPIKRLTDSEWTKLLQGISKPGVSMWMAKYIKGCGEYIG